MKEFLSGLFESVKRKKGYLLFLVCLSLTAIVLGIIAAVNFGGGEYAVDLSNIAYIRFFQGGGYISMLFGMILSLLVFLTVIILCCRKTWSTFLGVLCYLYLVYSNTVVFLSIILIYGIFNCIVLLVLLFVYILLVWIIFLLILCELSFIIDKHNYFKNCFNFNKNKILFLLLCLLFITFVFSLILVVLKNYVVLLIFSID